MTATEQKDQTFGALCGELIVLQYSLSVISTNLCDANAEVSRIATRLTELSNDLSEWKKGHSGY